MSLSGQKSDDDLLESGDELGLFRLDGQLADSANSEFQEEKCLSDLGREVDEFLSLCSLCDVENVVASELGSDGIGVSVSLDISGVLVGD